MTIESTAERARPEPASARRLGRRTRKAVLVVHIAAAGAWLGLDVVMGVLVITAVAGGDNTRAVSLQALELVTVGPMLGAGLLCLASGIVLGVGTKWGLVRYRWVAVKLVINVVLVVLVLVLLRPGVAETAAAGRELAAGRAADAAPGDMVVPPIVSTLALSVAITLSVYKPWGRRQRSVIPPAAVPGATRSG